MLARSSVPTKVVAETDAGKMWRASISFMAKAYETAAELDDELLGLGEACEATDAAEDREEEDAAVARAAEDVGREPDDVAHPSSASEAPIRAPPRN